MSNNVAAATNSNRSLLCAASAYFMWGCFPIYFILLDKFPVLEVLAHRALWSALVFVGILLLTKDWAWLKEVISNTRLLGTLCLSAALLSINWLLLVWSVTHGHVIDASLGYFINPLISVMLGWLMLGERLPKVKKLALTLATLGVAWLTWKNGHLPWIALGLATSFGLYGFLRKTAHLKPIQGVAADMFLMMPFALAYLTYIQITGHMAFAHVALRYDLLFIGSGIITVIPLILFAFGARGLSMATLGVIQYIGPSCQFLLGVFLLKEPFDHARLIGFIFIWTALAIYSGAGLWQIHQRNKSLKQGEQI